MTKRELGEFLAHLEGRMEDADKRRAAAEKRGDYESQLAWAGTFSGYEWCYRTLMTKYERMR